MNLPAPAHPFRGILCFILAFICLISIPFTVLAVSSLCIPDQYANTYYAAMKVKFNRLENTPGQRIIVISGSSAAFGIDSKIIEAELGIPCVNFGLYAAFGLKCMLDLSLGSLHDGDIVIIAPELSSQMYSDYVGYSYLLQALEGSPRMYARLGPDYTPGLLEALPAHLAEKNRFATNGSPNPEGVYSAAAFDEYGDIIYDRPANIMDTMVSADSLPEISEALVTDSFAQMINEYAAAASARGACVYFDFCPLNRLAVELANTDIQGFEYTLHKKLDFPILSSLEDHIMDEGYFYDSNFHLNNAGAVYHSILLINNLKREMGNMTPTLTQIPAPASANSGDMILSSGTSSGFHYDITAQGAVITGLDSDGLAAQHLIVPESIEGFQVYKIGTRAFSGCAAASIEIPSTVSVLSSSLFADAAHLNSVLLLSADLPEVGDHLLDGAVDKISISVPADLYGDYVTDYFWARYAEYLTPHQGLSETGDMAT